MAARRTPPLNLTLPPPVRTALEGLAAEDAAAAGRPSANLSATVSALVLAEAQRRTRRSQKKEHEQSI